MRRLSTLNPQLSRVLSETGHVDTIVVTDAGLPLPQGVERVDLAFRPGQPAFLDVLDTVLESLSVEGAIVASEVVEPARKCTTPSAPGWARGECLCRWSRTSSSKR